MSASISVNTARRDWFRILRDLTAAGIGYAKVARKCNRNSSTVANWANGSEPKESDARVVLALYAKHCPAKYLEHQRQFDIRLPGAPTPEPDLPLADAHPATAVAREIARMFSIAAHPRFQRRQQAKRQQLPAAPDLRQRSLFEVA